jgi:hypothetical protein
MMSLLLVSLAGCSLTDDPSLTPLEPVSWTSRLDAELGASPSGVAVSDDGDVVVTESVWSCVDGASAGVLRLDATTGASERVDWTRGFATSALASADGFSALLATSTEADPWNYGLSYREYAAGGIAQTRDEPTVVPTEMAGDPSGMAVLRGYHADTGLSFTRATIAGETAWETPDNTDWTLVPTHVAVAGDRVVATTFAADGWTLLRYDDAGIVRSAEDFCGGLVAADAAGGVYGAAIAGDGTGTVTLCRAGGEGAWTLEDGVGAASWATVTGLAVGHGLLVLTGTRDLTDESGAWTYGMWTRVYTLDGALIGERSAGASTWGLGAAVGPEGQIYVLGSEDTADGAVPMVLRYR